MSIKQESVRSARRANPGIIREGHNQDLSHRSFQNSVDSDAELQQLMLQVMKARKMENDYKNIENQIRCLKLRQLQQQQIDQDQKYSDHRETEAQIEDLTIDIAAKERRKAELEQGYEEQKQEYITLNNLEGEIHG